MSTNDLYAVPDGQTLVVLATGVEIVRRRKHEPIDMDGLDQQQLASRTAKKSGSKFLPGTRLEHIVRYTEAILTENNAVLNTSSTSTKTFADPVGVASGGRVRTITVLFDGRYAHAFPVAPEPGMRDFHGQRAERSNDCRVGRSLYGTALDR